MNSRRKFDFSCRSVFGLVCGISIVSIVLLANGANQKDDEYAIVHRKGVVTQTQSIGDKTFELIADFEANRGLFKIDTFKLSKQSTEGGQMVVFRSKDRDYMVFDAWIYGETGKLHAVFWTDSTANIKIARRTLYQYDRPFYESNFKTEESTEYFSFGNSGFRLYDGQRNEIKRDDLEKKKLEIQRLLTDLVKEAKFLN